MNLKNIENSIKINRFIVIGLFCITFSSYMIWFFLIQNQSLSVNSSAWGTFGDFVGGILNPLVAFSAFYWLTVSVLVQKQELGETRAALEEQAKLTLKNSKIEATNMLFQKVSIALEAELAYRNSVMENGFDGSNFRNVMTKSGKQVAPLHQIQDCNTLITRLEEMQLSLIEKVEKLIDET